mgnify:CR=1 FL=1
MTSSYKARKESSNSNANKSKDIIDRFIEKKRAIAAKYSDRGVSGKDQMFKELEAAEDAFHRATEKRENKALEDLDNVYSYGKDAMKGKSFAGYNKGGYATAKKYNKGGYAPIGASNPASQKRSK